MELVTEPMTKEQWAKEHAPTYKQDPNLPDSLDMCILCKAMCKKQNKAWPPCGNEKLNKAFQYYLLETEGQLEQLTTEEKFEFRCRLDPAFWAAFEFEFDGKPWVARWYQEMSLRCVATNKADMIGRRAGKCFTENTKLFSRGGRLVPIKELVGKTFTGQGINPKTRSILKRQSVTVTENIIQHTQRITLSSGKFVEVSDEHPLLTWKGWIPAKDIAVDDKIGTPANICVDTSKILPEVELKFLAYIIGDGGLTSKRTVKVSNVNPLVISELNEIATYFNARFTWEDDITGHFTGNKHKKNAALDYARKYGLMGKDAFKKTIPEEIFTLDNRSVSVFLSRLYSCDGWAYSRSNRGEIGYCTVNEELARQIQHLLLRFGVHSKVYKKKTSYRRNGVRVDKSGAWQVIISRSDDLLRFAKRIGIYGKQDAVNNMLSAIGRDINGFVPDPENIEWERVVSIEDLGEQQTYSITVNNQLDWDLRSVIANDIYSHNTETKIVECLHHCRYRIGAHGNDRAYAVHVFVPSENLLEHHWEEFEKFVQNSRTMKNMRIGGNKNDSIKFNNNTTIYVHILSMKSAIGTDAFFMWFDEAAFYDNDKALAHALGLAASHDNVPITMTSNSSGFQGKFYDYCNSSTTFMLQAPSYVNPEWNASKERFFRNNLTSEEYELLIKASWGESTSSVFKKDDIDYCLNAFPYSQAECSRSKPEGAFRCLGCDWNEAANGVHFVIVEFNERNAPEGRPLFKTVHKRAVRGEDWNHLAAQQVAWELLTGWDCDVAFLDFGGGGSLSVETVQRRCIESGRPALAQCVIPINMSEMITIPAPVSIGGAPTRKMQKNLIVNLCQILLERHQLAWPIEETFDSGQAIKSQAIIPQMRDYKVDRVSAKGYAVYGSASDIGDHTITAWMLAVYGCLVNKTNMLVGVINPTGTTWVPPPPLPSEKEKLKQKKPDATISKEIPGITQPQRAKGPGWGGHRPGRTNGLNNYRGRGW